MNQQCIFSSDTEALLAVQLFHLRNDKGNHDSPRSLLAIHTIYDLVAADAHDESFKDSMIAMKAMDTIVEAIKCPSVTIAFLHRAAGILVELLEGSTERSTCFINAGGIDCTLNILKTYASNCFVITSYVSVLVMMLHVVTDQERLAFAADVFVQVVAVLEIHSASSPHLYELSCLVIGLCCGPGVMIPYVAWIRAIQCTFDGLLMLHGYEDAQAVGRHLLIHMVGPDAALGLIARVELHHIQGDVCSCAA